MTDWFAQLTDDGFALLPGVLTPNEVGAARDACQIVLAEAKAASSVLAGEAGPAYGARNLLRLWPEVVSLVRVPRLAAALLRILGPPGGVVRTLYFDKPPGYSWALPWHRDLTVAVKKHGPLGRFNKPTKKAGVPHLEAPADLLATMVTARFHFDPVTDRNGPLRVLPGSHALDRAVAVGDREPVVVKCAAGDVLLMRPLLLHASGHSDSAQAEHRRIVHLELAPTAALADGYEWHDFIAVQETAAHG